MKPLRLALLVLPLPFGVKANDSALGFAGPGLPLSESVCASLSALPLLHDYESRPLGERWRLDAEAVNQHQPGSLRDNPLTENDSGSRG